MSTSSARFRKHHLLHILASYDQTEKPLDLLLAHYFRTNKAIGSKDRTYLYETLYTMMRWKSLLEWYTTPPFSWEKILSVLEERSIEELQHPSSLPEEIKLSTPLWLLKKLTSEYGQEKGAALCLINNSPAPLTIRSNPIKISRDELYSLLSKNYKVHKTERSPLGIQFEKRANLFTIPEFVKGFFEVQDEGSQLLSFLVDPTPGNHILDFCAGSGGKTLAFAPKTKGKGQIYLYDIRKGALVEAKKRLKRAGIQNIQIIPNEDKLATLKKQCNWVLVDAPCSGTGTLRRNPDMKWRLKESDIAGFAQTQRKIFAKALDFLEPGGKIVYGTCSLLRDENEDQIEYFIKTHQLTLVGSPLKILPSFGGTDGFFAAVLKTDAKKQPSHHSPL